MSPEFSRPVAVERITPRGLEVTVTATSEECAALAARLRLPAVHALACRFRLRPGPAGAIEAQGSLRARVAQTCIVSLDDFTAEVAEDFTVRFVPAGTEADEPDLDSPDEIPFEGTGIDLGEAASEQLALALDPYPRKPGAETAPEAGEAPATPFARLAALRREQ